MKKMIANFQAIPSFFLKNILFQIIFLFIIEWLGFHKIFSFWFFHGWEASWLMSTTAGTFTLQSLMQSHGFVSALNLLLFGWNPKGWFLTAFILHFLVTIVVVFTTSKITKNKLIGFLAGLFFVATTADHDVITWGSFESLYAAQTFGIYIALLFYLQFRQTKKKIFYILSFVTFGSAAILRESGILFIPVVFFAEIIIYQKKLLQGIVKRKITKQAIWSLIKLQIPFWLVGVCYLLLRASYGGSPNDFIDQRVQFRILLIHEHRYLEYVWYGLLAFGQYIPPYTLPYPVLNSIKDFVYTELPLNFIKNYFFVSYGWVTYTAFFVLLFLQRKTKYIWYLSFLLITFTIIILFYSFAWSTDETFLSLPYSWSENRWRYFAYTALAPFFVISLINFYSFLVKKLRRRALLQVVFTGIIVLSVVVNIIYLNKIETLMFWQNHFPSIRFYQTLTKNFPNLNSQSRFYYYRNAPSLNDFLAEFFYIKQRFYPNMKLLPQDWVRSQMYYIAKKFSDGELDQKNFYFMDYSVPTGVINKTKDVLAYYNNQQTINVLPELTSTVSGQYVVNVMSASPVEFPYQVHISASLSPTLLLHSQDKKVISEDNVVALSSFMNAEVNFMKNTKVTVCKTMDNQINEEFHNYRPGNIIDGNNQDRSRWWADCRPAWVVFDLGQEESIAGFAWGSYNAIDYVPRDYEYQISNDGKEWKTVLAMRANSDTGKMEKLPNSVKARYVRFFVDETVKGGMLALNEFTVIPEQASSIFSFYTSQKILFSDMDNFWNLIDTNEFSSIKNAFRPIVWVPFSWITTPQNVVKTDEQTYYIPLVADGQVHDYSFELPESELYSGNEQFLKRFVTSLSFEIPFDSSALQMQSFTYEPLFPSHQ